MTGASVSQRTARPWLPPLSIATFLGVLLFCVYIGSALYSSFDSMFFKKEVVTEDVPPYSAEEESRYCRAFGDGASSDRTVYIQPSGSIANRLGALAMSLHISSTLGAKHVMVWNGREEFSSVFTEDWKDIFQYPDQKTVSSGCFPGGARSHHRAQCTVLEIHSQEAWHDVLLAQNKNDATWPLCVRSSISLSQEDEGAQNAMLQAEFLQTLKPAQGIINHVYNLKQKVKWDDWGYWVGIDVTKYDQHTVENILKHVGSIIKEQHHPDSVRVVLMVENVEAETAIRSKLVSLYPDLEASGRIVSGSAVVAQRPGDWARSDIAKILLHSYCNVVITHDTLDECETAKFLGLDHCVSV